MKRFIQRLSLIFKQFWRCKVTFNPDKTALGMSSTQLVGHQIDATGRKFQEERTGQGHSLPVTANHKAVKLVAGTCELL